MGDLATTEVFTEGQENITHVNLNNIIDGATIKAASVTENKLGASSVSSSKVQNKAITFGKVQDVGTGSILGRVTSGSGSLEELSAGQVRTLLGLAATANSTCLVASSNLSDVGSASEARTNLGLASTATSTCLVASNNLSDITNASTARTNLGIVEYAPPAPSYIVKSDTFSTTSTSFVAITGISQSIALAAADKVKVTVTLNYATSSGSSERAFFQQKRGTTEIFKGDVSGSRETCTAVGIETIRGDDIKTISWCYIDEPATTGSVTYSIDARITTGTLYINRTRDNSDSNAYGLVQSSMILEKI